MPNRKVKHWVTVLPSDGYEEEVLAAETRHLAHEEAEDRAVGQLLEALEEGRDTMTDEQAATMAMLMFPREKD
jgi:hypothetical protein